MKMILGKKIGMSQLFLQDGKRIPITIIQALPNVVLENKTVAKNGYDATKIGYQNIDIKKLNKPISGYFKKNKTEPFKYIKELRDVTGYNVGDKICVDVFNSGDLVDVQAISKGKGFTGAIKRWNFKIGNKSHGAGFPHRYQGSVSFGRGGSQGQRVPKGKKMAGHMGNSLVTISNLTVVNTILANNLILLKGSVPGNNNSLVLIKTTKKAKKQTEPLKLYEFSSKKTESITVEKPKEEIKTEVVNQQNEIINEKPIVNEVNQENSEVDSKNQEGGK